MKIFTFSFLLMAIVLTTRAQSVVFSPVPTVTPGFVVPADSRQYVFLGPNIRQLTISYPGALAGGSPTERVTFTIKTLNQVSPAFVTSVKANPNGTFDYSYSVMNDGSSAEPVKVWSIAIPAVDAATSATHTSWTFGQESANGDPTPPKGAVSMSPVRLASWHAPDTGVAPGGTVAGFRMSSPYLPGITLIYARSEEDYALPAPVPPAVMDQLAPLRQRDWMNKRVLGIGPRFPKDFPRDVIAADFKDGVARLTESGALDPSSSFVKMLNSALETLIAAHGAAVPLDGVVAAAASPAEMSIASAISISLK